jgi:hypothetical protein
MVFDLNDGGVTPFFGRLLDASDLKLAGVSTIGTPLSIRPLRTFSSGLTVFIPCLGYTGDAEDLGVYAFDGSDWSLICDENGLIPPGMEGWLVPAWNRGLSKAVLDNGHHSGITLWSYRSGGFVLGRMPPE